MGQLARSPLTGQVWPSQQPRAGGRDLASARRSGL